ncbi:tetratricopeptide (TPR) repeat protein [Sphingomonas vulcanisoli]|uniref:Tetratricopeptide (TPR) repeat protein n=1 Tax=Sphingomonas vulcanisoli TaxID=1658060 RepID=A0ABX0TXX6_9SPHN|nr:hypothetical protein [Sphingomonas vulcanisoli]NIJ09049.1 tetratricopeptide (TPR) repeat protein [Sphingomonas vulcanisoli]
MKEGRSLGSVEVTEALLILATSLTRLAEHNDSITELNVAILLLQQNDRATYPALSHAIQAALVTALIRRSERTGNSSDLMDALLIAEHQLADCDRRASPAEWVNLALGAGVALVRLAEREDCAERAGQAVGMLRLALKHCPENARELWASTANALATALTRAGERTGDLAVLHEALTYLKRCQSLRSRNEKPLLWASTLTDTANVLARLGEREADPRRYRDAIANLRQALEVVTPNLSPRDYLETLNNLAFILVKLAATTGDDGPLDAALAAVDAAELAITEAAAPLDWAVLQSTKAFALLERWKMRRSMSLARQATRAAQNALRHVSAQQAPQVYKMVTGIVSELNSIGV